MINLIFTGYHFAAYELSSSGPSKNYWGESMGRFEFVPGVEKEGSPVYRQAHSKEVPSDNDQFLFRWEKPPFSFSLDLVMSGWLSEKGMKPA